MPYVSEEDRRIFDGFELPVGITAGQLNYVLTKLVDQWVGLVPNYDKLNSAIGVLDCCKSEFYRRVVSDYENIKVADNGDVYTDRGY